MKDKISQYMGLFVSYLSLFIIVKYSISTTIDVFYMIKHNEINNFVNEYVRVLQNFIFFGAFFSLFLSRLTSFSFIIPFAFLEVEHSFFNVFIAPYIISSHSAMSPEYIRIILFVLILMIFLFRAIWKKRKITDIFFVLSMSGVLATAILFHTITIKQLDYFTQKQEALWKQVVQYKNIEHVCAIENITCEEVNEKGLIKKDYVQAYYNEFKPYMSSYNEYFYYFISSDNQTQNRILARKPLAFVKYDKKSYYMLDNMNYTEYLKFNERMFGYLALSSHTVWIFGSLYLIHFHTRRRSKNKTIIKIDAISSINNDLPNK